MPHVATVRPEFWQDLLDQSDWYEAQQPGLGTQFEHEVRSKIGEILQRPLMYKAYKGELRRVLIARFPQHIVFVSTDTSVAFLGIVHAAREFETWLDRRQRP